MATPGHSDCLSDLTIDRILAGDLAKHTVEAHLAVCERCRTRFAMLTAEAEAARPTVERILRALAADHHEDD